MIPQHISDLANGLIAEIGHELSREQAVAMARRMVDYMERMGWYIMKREQR